MPDLPEEAAPFERTLGEPSTVADASKLPEEAVQAAAEALAALSGHPPVFWHIEARTALEAAMPVLEQHFRQDLSEWLMRVGKRALKDARNPVVPDPAGRGWAEAFIAAGILVDGGYPKKRGDADA